MLHVWLVPVLAVLVIALIGFYWSICCSGGGDGARKEGRCLSEDSAESDVSEEDSSVEGNQWSVIINDRGH